MKAQILKILTQVLPLLRPTILRPGERYSWSSLRADAVAGVTVAVIQIPQSMALALIAGLPAVYGLYASLFGFLASLWGSSRQLSTGPVAIVSFLTLTSLVPLATPGTPEYIQLAATLAFLVGIIYLLMGFLRLGFVLQLIPHTVIFGFSSAAAVVIIITQIPNLLGISVPTHELVFENVWSIVTLLPTLSVLTLLVGATAVGVLAFTRGLPKIFPAALVVLVLGVIADYTFDLGGKGVALVREVPQSLPAFTWPWMAGVPILALMPKAAIIALVGFVGTHASAKITARKTREHLDTDQELVGQGLANFVTAFFQGFPLSGSFTRTALNIEAGARTAIASVVTAIATVIALLFFAPLFYHLPRSILAAIVIIAAIPLIDIRRLREIYHISAMDGFVAFLTFTLVFVLKPDDAILIGVIVALMFFIRQTVWGEHVVEVGIERNLNILRTIVPGEIVDTFPGIAMIRISVSVYYANAAHIVEQIDSIIARHVLRESAPVKKLVLNVSGMNFIDVTGIEVLEEYFEDLARRGINIYLIYTRRSVREAFERTPGFPPYKVLQNIAEMKNTLLLAHK